MSLKINFIKQTAGLDYNFLTKEFKNMVKKLLLSTAEQENAVCDVANIIFLDNIGIKKYNEEYLNNKDETDVISLKYKGNNENIIDLLISLTTVEKNAEIYGTKYLKEMYRVIIHGFLHFCGYNDYNDKDFRMMKKLEDKYLKLIK